MKSSYYKKGLIMLFMIIITPLSSQEKEFTGDPDAGFAKAREMAFNKQRKQAQILLKRIIAKYPNYLDLRSFLANTYSWDGNYKAAREGFDFVLKKDPKRKTDWIAAIKNEFYADLPYRANELVKKALLHFPEDSEVLYQKARSEEKLNRPEEALHTLDEIIRVDAANKEAISYKQNLLNSLRFNTIGVGYSTIFYHNNERSQSHYSTLKYTRQTKYGSITGKVNYSRRFDTNSYQYEVDMYPRIIEGMYAYVSAGFSNSDLFPSVRYGAELYKSLPHSFEASLGFRGLKFSSTTTIYTGSVGWYSGNSYWSFRTYITPDVDGASKSGTLTYRKYYSDADNYFSLAIGAGFSPETERFPVNASQAVVFDLKSQKITGGYSFTSKSKKHAWSISLGVFREEKSFARGEYFLFYSFGISYGLRFR
ncbi:MAG: YaiO family outer membrane beta-barrel protein [Flavobacteriaceae bacterium]|nr:YaiO family outer membrane beta-barrel protein [Flavobacteriaceae bacterium]